MAEINEIAGGRYVIQEPLGEGGSGSIFRAWDQQLGRWVALKRIKENPNIEASIRHEAGVLAGLDHPNVVTVFDFGGDEGEHFVVMELLNGRTLEAIVQEQPLTVSKFIALMNQICRGLSAAHGAGLVHCDIKPANIMLQLHRDGSFTAKVLDFGLATASVSAPVPDSGSGESRTIQGSPLTISPEQLMGYPADIRSDIYSLGCTFYFALTGLYPHDAEEVSGIVQSHLYLDPKPLHRVNPEIPEPLSIAIMKMMARDPNARPQDVEAVRRSLEGAARAPSARGRNSTTRPLMDYSNRPTGTITSTIPPAPLRPPTTTFVPTANNPAQEYQAPEQGQYVYTGAEPQAGEASRGLRLQIIVSCCSLGLILVGVIVFWAMGRNNGNSTGSIMPGSADTQASKQTQDIVNMIGGNSSSGANSAAAPSTPSVASVASVPSVASVSSTPSAPSEATADSGDKNHAPYIGFADRSGLKGRKGMYLKFRAEPVVAYQASADGQTRILRMRNSSVVVNVPSQYMSAEQATSLVGKSIAGTGKLDVKSDTVFIERWNDISENGRPPVRP